VARVRYDHRALEVAAALGYRSHGGVVAALKRYDADRQRLARIARRVERDLTRTKVALTPTAFANCFQRGQRLEHFEIAPRTDMTPQRFQELLDMVETVCNE
jgi:hypothetical protein